VLHRRADRELVAVYLVAKTRENRTNFMNLPWFVSGLFEEIFKIFPKKELPFFVLIIIAACRI